MALLSLQADHEYSADWHLPGSTTSIAGRLSYTSRRADLHLNDAFTPIQGTISLSDVRPIYPAVHGVSSKGEALTLLKAQSVSTAVNLSSGGMRQPEQVVSSWLVVGAHIAPETVFKSVRFEVPGLEAWLSRAAIDHSSDLDNAVGARSTKFVIRAPEIEVTPAPTVDATLEWGAGANISANPYQSIAVTVRGWVTIRPTIPQPLEWYLDQQGKLAALLTFLAGAPMPVDAIQAYYDESSPPLSILVTLRQGKRCDFKFPSDFFVPRVALEESFAAIVAAWFQEVESILIPSQLAVGILTTESLWLHIKFASLIQALEGFHRGRFEGNYMSDTDYSPVKSVLSAAIPPSVSAAHRDALHSRIRYGNQISLSKRLTELRDCLGDQLASLIIARDGKIPRSWIDTRNYHTHWDEELRPNALDGQAMYNANVRMEHFLRALYLLMAGVPQETVLRCLQGSSDTAQQLVHLNIIDQHAADRSAPVGVLMSIGTGEPSPPSSETKLDSQGDASGSSASTEA
jgi:hypothetical protein